MQLLNLKMGCLNCRDFNSSNSLRTSYLKRDEILNTRQSYLRESNELNFENLKEKTTKTSYEKLSTRLSEVDNILDKKMNYSCKNYNKEANYLYKEEKKEIAKKLTENESNPSSMNYKIIINGHDNLNNDFSCNKKSNVEESNYFDYDINFHRDSYKRNNVPKSKKSITKKNRINNLCMKSAEINGENLKNSFISINKETITKYQHLFSDVDVCNYKSNRSNLRTPKNLMITQLEDGDLTNFQKIPKMCSSNLLNYSEDCTNKINIKSNCIKSCPAQEEENIIQY